MTPTPLTQAYAHCRQQVRSHYENFPVASLLLPRALRRPITVIYAFARSADDFADEGTLPPERRLVQLDGYARELDAIHAGKPSDDPLFIALADVITNHRLPLSLFHDLLAAFRMDIRQQRYNRFDDVLHYCRHSANPVGRLLLHLTDTATPQHLRWSDAICSALQLINFYQDLAQDYDENGRIYLPLDEMQRFGVSEEHLRARRTDLAMTQLMEFHYARARHLMLEGAPLGHALHGRFALQLRMMINGGLAVLDALERNRHQVFARPRLRTRDWLGMTWRALWRITP